MACSVLIVDNAPYARERLRAALESHGYDVAGEAKDAASALELYRKRKPDVVTLDLLLTGEHGFKTLLELKRLDPDARIVVVSALSDRETVEKAARLGACAYVTKAEDWSQIEAALRQALKRSPEQPSGSAS